MNQPQIGFVNLLEQEIRRKTIACGKSPIRPSSAEKCPRENAFRMTEYLGRANYQCEPLSPATVMLLEHGKTIEGQLIRHFEENGFEVLHQQQPVIFSTLRSTIDPKFHQKVTGSIDCVLKRGDELLLVDIKSVGGTQWTWDAKSKKIGSLKSVTLLSENSFWIEDVDSFLDELQDPFLRVNFAQLNYYAQSEFIKNLGIDQAAIIQFSKVDSRLRELRFKPSVRLFEKSNQGFIEAMDAVATGRPESASGFSRESVSCRYCRYNHVCPTTDSAKTADNQQERKV